MKIKLYTLLVIAALLTPGFAEEEDTPLAQEMSKVSKALKVINRSIADPAAKDANLAKVAEAKASAEKALTMEPSMTKDVPEAEKAKFIEDYKAAMNEMIKGLDELKVAVESGKAEDVTKVMEKLNSGKKDGHKKFQKEEE